MMNVPEKGIPRELPEKAEAVGVFPNVVKSGFSVRRALLQRRINASNVDLTRPMR